LKYHTFSEKHRNFITSNSTLQANYRLHIKLLRAYLVGIDVIALNWHSFSCVNAFCRHFSKRRVETKMPRCWLLHFSKNFHTPRCYSNVLGCDWLQILV